MSRLLRLPALLLSALLLAAAVAAPAGRFSPSTPEDTAVRFITAFAEGDVQEALELINFPERIRRNDTAMGLASGKIKQMVAAGRARIEARGGLRAITPVDTAVSTAGGGQAALRDGRWQRQ